MFVSDLSSGANYRRGLMFCPRCAAEMDQPVSIPPSFREPGLRAFDCPKCHYTTSVLLQPELIKH